MLSHYGLRVCSFVIVFLILTSVLFTQGSNGKRRGYELEGTWSDACPCKVPCPCWGTKRANAARCVNLQVFHVNKGSFNNVDLADSTFILVGVPAEQFGTPDLYRAYFDQSSRNVSVSDLFSQAFGLPLERGAEQVPSIEATIREKSHSVAIAGVLSYAVGAQITSNDVTPSPEVQQYLYPWLRDARQWVTHRVTHRLNGEAIDYAGTNSLQGKFHITSEDK